MTIWHLVCNAWMYYMYMDYIHVGKWISVTCVWEMNIDEVTDLGVLQMYI